VPSGTWLGSATQHADVKFEVTLQVDSAASQFDFFGSGWPSWRLIRSLVIAGLRRVCCCVAVRMVPAVIECSCRRSIRNARWCDFPDGGYVPLGALCCSAAASAAIVGGGFGERAASFAGWSRGTDICGRTGLGRTTQPAGLLGLGASSGVPRADIFRSAGFGGGAIACAGGWSRTRCVCQVRSGGWAGGSLCLTDAASRFSQLHSAGDPAMFAKLRPGSKPVADVWFSAGVWMNQGAYREAAAEVGTESRVSGGGESLQAEVVGEACAGSIY
jgi:hypothetical protein